MVGSEGSRAHMRALVVSTGAGPLRLDAFLARHLPNCSRRTVQRAIAAGAVRVGGRRARKGQMVTDGDLIQVPDELGHPSALQPNPRLVVHVLYEDAAVIALDKPAGMPSHALRADETETIANFLLARHPELATVGKNDREPGLVHRLDTDTSGVLLVARTANAYAALRQQFAARQVTKEYLALVQGDIALPGEVRTPIAHDPRNRRKMRACPERADHLRPRPAITHYAPIERFGGCTLLSVRIPTGVRHQIRVHLASIGHAVVGDRLYGMDARQAAPSRHLLHACRLVFEHPTTGKPTEIYCPPPADFSGALAGLRQPRGRRSRGR